MVRGLARFKEHFARFPDQYVLIGGTACELALEKIGLAFRATKDLDIVLCVEALNPTFVEAFWQFVKEGKYKNRQRSTGKEVFYRFDSPEDARYPDMLELFSRKPIQIALREESHLTPIPVAQEISSLSAILLNDDYYSFIHQGKQEVEGLPIVGAQQLVPLKARAWLDLTERKKGSAHVDESDIRKHKNDIIRLFQLLDEDISISLPELVKRDLEQFLDLAAKAAPINLKSLGLRNTRLEDVILHFRQIYGIS